MFTGLVSTVGQLSADKQGRYTIACATKWLQKVMIGDSIAVNGACLTVVNQTPDSFCADVSSETRLCCVPLQVGEQVNLEQSLRPDSLIGGHFLTGHIDGVATVMSLEKDASGGATLRMSPPLKLIPFIAEKGSIALAGVSLTVNRVSTDYFELYLIPHTLQNTVLSMWEEGQQVNIEVDILARYVAKQLQRI